MESRWGITFTEEQKSELLHINFVNDTRDELPELPEAEITLPDNGQTHTTRELKDRHYRRNDFWSNFVNYCKLKGRENDIALRKASYADWYDVLIGSHDYHIFFQLYRQKKLRIGLYVYKPKGFARLESKKDDIEKLYGSEFEWYTSRAKSTAKRILHSIDTDVHNPDLYHKHFDWLISQFDKLRHALQAVDSNVSER